MTQKEFIQKVLINETRDIVEHHQYLSFAIITSGIELLGTCIETEKQSFFGNGNSKKRFEEAIVKLFPSKYHQSKSVLYKELRCGMNHSLLPKAEIALSERKHGQKNLAVINSQLVLVAEDFFADFELACTKVIELIDKGEVADRFALNRI